MPEHGVQAAGVRLDPVHPPRQLGRDQPTAYIMIGGAVAIVAVFTLYPVGYALIGSLYNLSPILPTSFAGLMNFSQIFGSQYFGFALKTTAVFALLTVPAIVVLGLLVALLLDRRFRGDGFVKVAILLPWTIPAATGGVMWKGVFADSWGALNGTLYQLGLIREYISWLTDPTLAVAATTVAQVWAQFPLAAVLLLAAMQAIPDELYEAAAIDGASGLRRFAAVTFPHIRPMLIVVILFELLLALTAFDLIFAMTGGGPGTATTVLSYFIWSESFKMLSFGRGMALAVIIAGMAVILIAGLLRFMPRGALLEEVPR
ncbi:MAG: carbohydrate ABC transporter permease [bacterium]